MPRGARHYAWTVLALCFIAILFAQGLRLAFGAFVRPWEEEFDVSRGTITLIGSLSFLVYGGAQPFVGRAVDLLGIRRTLVASTPTEPQDAAPSNMGRPDQRFLPPPERLPDRRLPLARAPRFALGEPAALVFRAPPPADLRDPPPVLREADVLRAAAPAIFREPPVDFRDPPDDLRDFAAPVLRAPATAFRAPPPLLREPPRALPEDRLPLARRPPWPGADPPVSLSAIRSSAPPASAPPPSSTSSSMRSSVSLSPRAML